MWGVGQSGTDGQTNKQIISSSLELLRLQPNEPIASETDHSISSDMIHRTFVRQFLCESADTILQITCKKTLTR